jgi:hypothetical protein
MRAGPPPRLPPTSAQRALQVRGHACSAHSPQPSSTRPPRANHPSPGAVSPRNIRPDPIRKAFRAARCGSSRRMASWWARVHASVDSSSWPVKYAASPSFSRSSRPSGVAASAVANCAYASPHERWAKDARACSSTPILLTAPVWCAPATTCPRSRRNGRRSGGRRPSSRWISLRRSAAGARAGVGLVHASGDDQAGPGGEPRPKRRIRAEPLLGNPWEPGVRGVRRVAYVRHCAGWLADRALGSS